MKMTGRPGRVRLNSLAISIPLWLSIKMSIKSRPGDRSSVSFYASATLMAEWIS